MVEESGGYGVGGLRIALDHPASGLGDELVRSYHDALLAARGVQGYDLDHCWSDYELATVLSPARLAYAVGLSDLQPHPGAFWDARFPRFA